MDRKQLKQFRINLNLSQSEFGRKVGVSRGTIERLENGKYELKGSLAKAIEYFYKMKDINFNK